MPTVSFIYPAWTGVRPRRGWDKNLTNELSKYLELVGILGIHRHVIRHTIICLPFFPYLSACYQRVSFAAFFSLSLRLSRLAPSRQNFKPGIFTVHLLSVIVKQREQIRNYSKGNVYNWMHKNRTCKHIEKFSSGFS